MKKRLLLLPLLLLIGWTACKEKVADYPIEPQIYYLNMSTDHIKVSDQSQFVDIHFRFTDGDQDIARNQEGTDSVIFLKDSRDTDTVAYTYVYPMPYIPGELRPKGGLEGHVTLHLTNAYFSPRDSLHLALGKDTMVWFLYIEDEAGHKSNTIKTDTIYLDYQ